MSYQTENAQVQYLKAQTDAIRVNSLIEYHETLKQCGQGDLMAKVRREINQLLNLDRPAKTSVVVAPATP